MKKLQLNKKDIPIYLFCLYIFVEILISTEITYLIKPIFFSAIKYLFAGATLIFLLFDIKDENKNINLSIFLVLGYISLIILFKAKILHILMLVTYMYLFRRRKLEDILKFTTPVLIIVYLITIFGSITGIYPNIDHNRQGLDRNALGFYTPTLGQSILLFIMLSRFYLKKNKFSWIEIAVFTVLNFVIYYFTAGRTGFYLAIAAIIIIAVYKLLYKTNIMNNIINNKAASIFIIALPVIFLALSLLLTKLYYDGYEFAIKLNDALSTRLLLQQNAFLERKITVFGQDIYWFNEENIYIGVDNSYLYHLFNYGIIIFVLAIIMYMYILYTGVKNKNYPLLIVAGIILIDAIVEPYMLDFKYNCFMFSISYIFIGKENINTSIINYNEGSMIN